MSVIDKIRRRRCYPVSIDDGTVLHVRPLGGWDRLELSNLSTDDQLPFSIGRCLVNETAERIFERSPGELLCDYISRVKLVTGDLSISELSAILNAISKVTKVPDADSLLKNSDPMETQGS